MYPSTILVPFASSDLLKSLKKKSSGSVAISGQSSAQSAHFTSTDSTLVNPPMQSSSILTIKSASHIVSYSLTPSTFNSLSKGNTVIPTHPTVEKLVSSTVSTSRHSSISASHVSDSRYLNKVGHTTAQQVVQFSSLSSFQPKTSNSFSTLTTFTTIYKEWTGTFTSTYSTQVSTLNFNNARMVERAVGHSSSRVPIEIIYYIETPKANEALLTINANNSAASSQTIGNIATVTSCSSYMCTGVVSPAVISTVTTKIEDAVTELTIWCPFSVPDSADKTIETFMTSSLLNVNTDFALATSKHTPVPTANNNTVTKDITVRPSFGTEIVFGSTRTDIAVTLESVKTAIPHSWSYSSFITIVYYRLSYLYLKKICNTFFMFLPQLSQFTGKKEEKMNLFVLLRKCLLQDDNSQERTEFFFLALYRRSYALHPTHGLSSQNTVRQRLGWCVFFHAPFRARRGFAYILPMLHMYII